MKYDFPLIENISDVLPAIEGSSEFIVAEREGYTVINYHVVTTDTFPPVNVSGGSAKMRAERSRHAAIRRECRGIIFDSVSGHILRRPFHKFFNLNEKVETQTQNISLDAEHEILDKLDGSMIAPFIVGDRMIWGTKMGDTEVAQPVHEFVASNPNYVDLAITAITFMGMTPIFEWCSRKQRIVIDYSEDQLVLIAMRDMKTGVYTDYNLLQEWADAYNVPVVGRNPKFDDVEKLMEFARNLVDEEGFVVRFSDGHMVKMKSDWYVAIHKAKEAILWDRNIVQLVLDEKLDDVMAHLPNEDRIRLEDFRDNFWKIITAKQAEVVAEINDIRKSKMDRKTFALTRANDIDPHFKSIIFSTWDDENYIDSAYSLVLDVVRKNLTKNVNYDRLRNDWFPKVRFNHA